MGFSSLDRAADRLGGDRVSTIAKALAALVTVCGIGVAHAEPAGAPPAATAATPAKAEGGPLIPVPSAEASADLAADGQFRSLFQTWKRMDTFTPSAAIAIPAIQPVTHVSFSSYFGVRTDPFRGTAAMHPGVDMPGAIGTPIYATADGIVDRAERAGGYGNLVEIDHGRGIATRYGHLSKILVTDHQRVKRGQLIALMGSTGRSTGSHLHYEVRIDGHAVNPMPFLTQADFLQAVQSGAIKPQPIAATPGAVESED